MVAKKRGLGRGLDALLSTGTVDAIVDSPDMLKHVPVDLIQRGQFQPRKTMNPEALEELADSIRSQGIVQPILIRPLKGSEKFEIIAGERRWRAAQMAGLHDVPVVIREVTDQEAACVALIENIQREDLNPLEEARTFSRLLKEFGMTHESVAEAVGRSRSSVSNFLRLLEMNQEVQALLASGEIEMGHARAIAGLPLEQQPEIARRVVKKGLSVRETEQLVRKAGETGKKKSSSTSKPDPNIRKLQEQLSDKLGAKVQIRHRSGGKGSLEIHYSSLDHLEGILKRFK